MYGYISSAGVCAGVCACEREREYGNDRESVCAVCVSAQGRVCARVCEREIEREYGDDRESVCAVCVILVCACMSAGRGVCACVRVWVCRTLHNLKYYSTLQYLTPFWHDKLLPGL